MLPEFFGSNTRDFELYGRLVFRLICLKTDLNSREDGAGASLTLQPRRVLMSIQKGGEVSGSALSLLTNTHTMPILRRTSTPITTSINTRLAELMTDRTMK